MDSHLPKRRIDRYPNIRHESVLRAPQPNAHITPSGSFFLQPGAGTFQRTSTEGAKAARPFPHWMFHILWSRRKSQWLGKGVLAVEQAIG